MSIQTEFFTLLIPIHHLVRELGFSATQKILLEVEHDDHLVHIGGTMDSADIPFMIESWKEKGLRPISGRGKSRRWHECCIVSRVSGPTMPCSWLKFDIETGLADWVSGKA